MKIKTRNRSSKLAASALRTVFFHPIQTLKSRRRPRRWTPFSKPTAVQRQGATRYTWQNCVGDQVVQPLRFFYPSTRDELIAIVKDAQQQGCKVKLVGSGHSFSDIMQTTDYLIDPHGLDRVLPLDESVLKPDWKSRYPYLANLENGITIRKINDYLDQHGMGLINMGSYDAQTVMGAASTATHGSGITLGATPDFVVSADVINEFGNLVRIEPADGITDPVKFKAKYPNIDIIQDDDTFYSSIVAMCCSGIVYSVMVKVRERYFLEEKRWEDKWSNVKKMISLNSDLMKNNLHVDVYVNPHETDGDHTCVISIRNEVPTTTPVTKRHDIADLLPYNSFTKWLYEKISLLLVWVFNTFPRLTPTILNSSMGALVEDSYVNVSYKVMNLGNANFIPAFSNETSFPMENDEHIKGIDEILRVSAECSGIGELFLSVPIGVRFVRPSEHLLSMMYHRQTCMVEVPNVNGTHGAYEMLRKIEDVVCTDAYKGRMHWGQVNYLNRQKIERSYPQTFARWLAYYKKSNTTGIFSNSFTNRCSLDE